MKIPKKNKLCGNHMPTFFINEPNYKIVSKNECSQCKDNKKMFGRGKGKK